MTTRILAILFLPFIISIIGAWIIGKYGLYLNLMDKPNGRSSHHTAKPKGGGIGILLGFVIVATLLRLPAYFWIPAAILSFLSFLSDRYTLSILLRLLAQFGASLIFLIGILNWHPFSSAGLFIVVPLSIFIVGTSNYYNFMDGINGIAGITGIVGFSLLAFYSHYYSAPAGLIILNISMAFCCLGFLPFNFPRPRVFMGDVGSILLGFVFATMIIWLSKNFFDFVCLSSFILPYYADVLTTEFVLLKHGDKIWKSHRRHLYQILANEYGIGQWKISLVYGFGQLIVGLSVLIFMDKGFFIVLSILLFYFAIFTLISGLLRKKLVLKNHLSHY